MGEGVTYGQSSKKQQKKSAHTQPRFREDLVLPVFSGAPEPEH